MTTITRFDPFRPLALHSDVERLFRELVGTETPASAGAFAPALDVEETADGFVLHIELPGVKADEVEITLEENVITVTGERSFYADREEGGFRRIERSFGKFHRAVRLPDRVDAAKVDARYGDGILTITVPKAEDAKPRRIAIRAS